ncbi:hypothetical protein AYI70_g6769, partial [Smittium culicis]
MESYDESDSELSRDSDEQFHSADSDEEKLSNETEIKTEKEPPEHTEINN